jgi:hypothetical protein
MAQWFSFNTTMRNDLCNAAGDSTLLAYTAKVEAGIGRQTRGAAGGPREQWDKVHPAVNAN